MVSTPCRKPSNLHQHIPLHRFRSYHLCILFDKCSMLAILHLAQACNGHCIGYSRLHHTFHYRCIVLSRTFPNHTFLQHRRCMGNSSLPIVSLYNRTLLTYMDVCKLSIHPLNQIEEKRLIQRQWLQSVLLSIFSFLFSIGSKVQKLYIGSKLG